MPMLSVTRSLKRMLLLAWRTDKFIICGYYLSAGVAALFTLASSFILKYLIDNLIIAQNPGLTKSIPAIVIILLGAKYIVGAINNFTAWGLYQTYFDYLFRYKIQNKLNNLFYEKMASLDIAHLENPQTQDLIAKARDTMTWRPPDFLRTFSYFFSSSVSYVSAFIVLLSFGWWIPLVITVINIPYLYFRAKYGSLQWSLYGSGAPEVRKMWYFGWLFTTPTVIREMRIFKANATLLSKYIKIQEYLLKLNKKPISSFVRMLPVPILLEGVVLFGIAAFQLPLIMTGLLTVGSFTLLINMIDSLSGSAGSLVLNFGELYTHSLYVDHYFDVLALPIIIKESEHPKVFRKIAPPKIEFKNVSFAYLNGPLVLKNISFVINPGENVAFVGENGAGKTTIIKLLCRFYDVTEGEILVNGVNLKNIKLSQWYDFLGTLFQEFVQYHFTVRENITLGSTKNRGFSVMKEASEKSGAYEFIEKLPNGFDTILGKEFEDGEELSVGQWQKIALARAFYEEAPVLILDEPTSAIDAEAEYEIFANLEKSYKDKTLVLVSHRFSTVRNANKIFVVQDGKITESGTHEELIKLNKKYASMFLTQAKGYS